MESKNYTQVLIDGKIYTLGGSEEEGYLQKAASYVNEKKSQMRKIPGYSKQNADYQTVMMELNIADDYFKAMERADGMERQKNELEKEAYSLKHEMVSTQMKLEAVLKDLEERQREMDKLARRSKELEGELEKVKQQLKARSEKAEPVKAAPSADHVAGEAVGEAAGEAAATVESGTNAPGLLDNPESQEPAKKAETAEELAQKALQAARKASGHKGGRR